MPEVMMNSALNAFQATSEYIRLSKKWAGFLQPRKCNHFVTVIAENPPTCPLIIQHAENEKSRINPGFFSFFQ